MLLRAWTNGDESALEKLTPVVYDELHRLAHHYMQRERSGHSLQTTALVNEAYTRLVDYKRMQWQNRAHFFAISAQLMRRILVDYARRHNVTRGGGLKRVPLEGLAVVDSERAADLVALDDAMNALARLDPRKSTSCRNAFLRRPERRRDRGGARCVARHRDARLEHSQSVALP